MEVEQFGNPEAGRVLIQPVDKYELASMEGELSALRGAAGEDFCLLAVPVGDWNGDLSPWPAPAVFGTEAFAGRGRQTLEGILSLCADRRREYYLGGYSLAGLFALWAGYETDAFAGVAAASGSVWYPGFDAYTAARRPRTGRVYLSLGDREARTRNPVMATVADRMQALHTRLEGQGIPCVLEWNPGNHFRDPHLRTARALSWLLSR